VRPVDRLGCPSQLRLVLFGETRICAASIGAVEGAEASRREGGEDVLNVRDLSFSIRRPLQSASRCLHSWGRLADQRRETAAGAGDSGRAKGIEARAVDEGRLVAGLDR